MSQAWGAVETDYIPKRLDVCARCHQRRTLCDFASSICDADLEIKHDYWLGRTKKAMDTLRCLPTEALKDYLPKERRTPADLKAVILDELERRGEYDKPKETMRL